MRSRPLSLTFTLFLLAAFTLVAATACDSEPPAPVPTPTPVASATATAVPTNTPTPTSTATPTHTPTNTATPTETPQPTFVSLPGPQPTTIVRRDEAAARQQYESELAKWRAQHILEYDLLVRHESTAPFAGTWNLRVTPIGIEMLGYSPIGVITPTTPPARMGGDALRFLTVDGLFASVEFRLNEQFGAALEARVDYVATFDPELGYPISVQIMPRRGNDLASSTTIERLIITRRAILTPTPTAAPTDTPAPTPTETGPATLTVVPVTALPPSPSPPTVVGTVTRSPGPAGSPQPAP